MKQAVLFAVVILLLLASFCLADTLIPLEGKPLHGKVSVAKNGNYTVELTKGGKIEFKPEEVASVEFSPSLLDQYQNKAVAVKTEDDKGHYELAMWCATNSLRKQAKKHFQKTVDANPDHALAHQALGQEKFNGRWMSYDEVMAAKGFVRYNDRWITSSERDWFVTIDEKKTADKELGRLIRSKKPGDPQTLARIEELLATASDADQLSTLQKGLRSKDAKFRAFCAKMLGAHNKNEENFSTLVDVAILDKNRNVRKAAVTGLQRLTKGTDVSVEAPFLKAMEDERAAVRIAAADALGIVGSSGASDVLLTAYRMTWGTGARNHIAVVLQHAYVEDYDVQVATGASVADPVIGVIQEGIVLDIKPLRVERTLWTLERKIIRDTYKKIMGDNLPKSEEGFNKWDKNNKMKYRK